MGPGGTPRHRLEAEGQAIGGAHAAGGSAAIRPDTVIRLLHRELARRPQRVRPDRGADVATHITGLSGEGEPTLHLESVDARSHPRGDEADHGIVVHMQHVRPHGLSDLADFFRVRGREHGETVRGYDDFQARFGRRGREIVDRKSTRLNSSHGYTSYAVFCLQKRSWR